MVLHPSFSAYPWPIKIAPSAESMDEEDLSAIGSQFDGVDTIPTPWDEPCLDAIAGEDDDNKPYTTFIGSR